MNQKKTIFMAFLLPLLSACASSPERQASERHDYSTQTRVEYVLQCMQEHGGQSYDTLYPCICKVDTLATRLTADELEQAQTFVNMSGTAGEAGGLFRESAQARTLKEKLREAEAFAEKRCFVK